MIIKSDRATKSKNIRTFELPEVFGAASESANMTSENPEVLNVEDCVKRIEALEREIDRTQKSSYREGFQSGEKAGYEQGLESIQGHIEKFVEIIDSTRLQQEAILMNSEDFVLDFALKIVERIIGTEQFSQLQIEKSKLQKIVEEALNFFADSTQCVIRVHQDTALVLEQYRADILTQLNRPVAISIIDDPSLRPCDCLIETEHGVLDARIDSQFKEIRSVFRKK